MVQPRKRRLDSLAAQVDGQQCLAPAVLVGVEVNHMREALPDRIRLGQAEAEIVLKCIFDSKAPLTVDAPPYIDAAATNFDNEQCSLAQQQRIDDVMPNTIELARLFEA